MMRAQLVLRGLLGALPLLSVAWAAHAQAPLPPYLGCTVGRGRLLTSENGLRGGTVGDFDRSRSPDLALLDRDNIVIVLTDSTLLRQGSCAEGVSASTFAAQRPQAIDVIGVDATLDLAVLQASSSTKNAALFIGNGTGAFTPGLTSRADLLTDPRAMAAGLIDQNSLPDLVVGDANTLAVMLAPGGASVEYLVTQRLTLGNNPVQEVGLADFSHDGLLDIASLDFGGTVRVFAQTAAGEFNTTAAASRSLQAGASPQDMQIADADLDDPNSLPPLNGDENADIVFLSTNAGAGQLQVFLGNATDANFTVRNPIPAGEDPAALALGDFNLDGDLDVAVADAGASQVLIFLGDGTGALSQDDVSLATGSIPTGILVANVDDDAYDDIITTNIDGSITIFLSSNPPSTPTPTPTETGLPTPTSTASPTAQATPSETPTSSPSRTVTNTRTPEPTRTETETPITPGIFAVQGEGCAHISGGSAGLSDGMPLLVLAALAMLRRVSSRRR